MIVQVGSNEILLDDSRRLEQTFGGYDGGCNLQVWPGMHHLRQLHGFLLSEGREAFSNIACSSIKPLQFATHLFDPRRGGTTHCGQRFFHAGIPDLFGSFKPFMALVFRFIWSLKGIVRTALKCRSP